MSNTDWNPDRDFIDFIAGEIFLLGGENDPIIGFGNKIITNADIIRDVINGTDRRKRLYEIWFNNKGNQKRFQEFKDRGECAGICDDCVGMFECIIDFCKECQFRATYQVFHRCVFCAHKTNKCSNCDGPLVITEEDDSVLEPA